MKLALTLCLMCSLFYAIETFIAAIGIVIISGTCLALNPPTMEQMPVRADYKFILLVTVFFFLADYFHFLSLHKNSGAVLLSTTYVLIPVFCSVLKWEKPSPQVVIAWILGAIAILLIGQSTMGKEEG
jgi:hypothetical protein